MRTELYEQYKQEHPEELLQVQRVFDYDHVVRTVRARAREEKIRRVDKWIAILEKEGENGETGSDS